MSKDNPGNGKTGDAKRPDGSDKIPKDAETGGTKGLPNSDRIETETAGKRDE